MVGNKKQLFQFCVKVGARDQNDNDCVREPRHTHVSDCVACSCAGACQNYAVGLSLLIWFDELSRACAIDNTHHSGVVPHVAVGPFVLHCKKGRLGSTGGLMDLKPPLLFAMRLGKYFGLLTTLTFLCSPFWWAFGGPSPESCSPGVGRLPARAPLHRPSLSARFM